jgi:hypothetical protein
VNTDLVKGYNLISNPLDNKNGNVVKDIFANLVPGAQIFVFNGTKYDLAEVDLLGGGVTGVASTKAIPPGNGVFVFVDAPTKITFVGEVVSGATTTTIPAGFSIKASVVPTDGTATSLSFPAGEGDQIFTWNSATQKYTPYSFSAILGGWDPADPSIKVGEAIFVNNVGAQKNWTRQFDINK